MKERQLKQEHEELLKREEIFWKDKAKETWLKEGDVNTKYFHAIAKTRRDFNKIEEIKDEKGDILRKKVEIEEAVITFFEKILGSDKSVVDYRNEAILDCIRKIVIEVDNKLLEGPITMEEV